MPLLIIILTCTWFLFLAMTYIIFSLIIPITPPAGSPYSVVFGYAVLKLLLSGVVFLAWLLSYYLMRDLFVRLKNLEIDYEQPERDRNENKSIS
ncbi:MAG: hypothetical protein QXE12_02090 [Conexivisphaerales archaeon]